MAEMIATQARGSGSARRWVRPLLTGGLLAGPLYVVVGAVEALTRPGFDPTRDDLSLLSNGPFGWIHIALFISAGLLTIAGAVGLRRAGDGGDTSVWGPVLLGLYGLGLIGAGIFVADPMHGFPPGTPAGAHSVSAHGLMHLVSGAVGFLGLIASCLVFARRFARVRQTRWARFSVATGGIFLVAFFGIAGGSRQDGAVLVAVTLAFTAAVVLAWTWISAVCAKAIRELR